MFEGRRRVMIKEKLHKKISFEDDLFKYYCPKTEIEYIKEWKSDDEEPIICDGCKKELHIFDSSFE